jgi:hypothetical protein
MCWDSENELQQMGCAREKEHHQMGWTERINISRWAGLERVSITR